MNLKPPQMDLNPYLDVLKSLATTVGEGLSHRFVKLKEIILRRYNVWIRLLNAIAGGMILYSSLHQVTGGNEGFADLTAKKSAFLS